MTRLVLLDALKAFTEHALKDLILPVRMQEGDAEQTFHAPSVYLMRLPDSTSAMKKAPYVLHQIITSKDNQPSGELPESRAVVRTIVCVYSDNEQDGALALLNVMERLRISLLRNVVIGQFELDLQEGVETLIYPDDTAPYFAGEMVTTWRMPPVKREVNELRALFLPIGRPEEGFHATILTDEAERILLDEDYRILIT